MKDYKVTNAIVYIITCVIGGILNSIPTTIISHELGYPDTIVLIGIASGTILIYLITKGLICNSKISWIIVFISSLLGALSYGSYIIQATLCMESYTKAMLTGLYILLVYSLIRSRKEYFPVKDKE